MRLLDAGKKPLHELAIDHPVMAWRMWTKTYPRDYHEHIEVCSTPASSMHHLVCMDEPFS